LLVRGCRSCFYPSIYLDANDEISENFDQKKPLFLSMKSYKKLENIYLKHQVAREITRQRSIEENRIIRSNFY
jgi:hypothetical protein